jgi:hypothetical protein
MPIVIASHMPSPAPAALTVLSRHLLQRRQAPSGMEGLSGLSKAALSGS